MKKGCLIAAVVVIVLILAVGGWLVGVRNSFVDKEETVESAWSQVENVYQRRADLVPNLVATVKGYAEHEQSTLEGVMNARAKATQVTIDPANLDAESIKRYQEAQGELGAALSRLIAVSENYPDLKANENFMTLQAQLEGTENRITTERKKFNDVARDYNATIRKFPGSIVAAIFGFDRKPYFEAMAGAEVAPKVEF